MTTSTTAASPAASADNDHKPAPARNRRPRRRYLAAGTGALALALTATFAAGCGGSLDTAAAGTTTETSAPGAGTSGEEITFVDTNPRNTDLDLGAPGLSVGDMQIFNDDLTKDGQPFGTSIGQCVLTLSEPTRLINQCTATYLMADGTLAVRFINDQDPAAAPTKIAGPVVGGTGRYRGASGDLTATFQPNTDTMDVIIRLG